MPAGALQSAVDEAVAASAGPRWPGGVEQCRQVLDGMRHIGVAVRRDLDGAR